MNHTLILEVIYEPDARLFCIYCAVNSEKAHPCRVARIYGTLKYGHGCIAFTSKYTRPILMVLFLALRHTSILKLFLLTELSRLRHTSCRKVPNDKHQWIFTKVQSKLFSWTHKTACVCPIGFYFTRLVAAISIRERRIVVWPLYTASISSGKHRTSKCSEYWADHENSLRMFLAAL